MLACVNINEQLTTVYTVPSGKKALIYLDIHSPTSYETSIYIRVNSQDYLYYTETFSGFRSFKLTLDAGDSIRINGNCIAFVHGVLLNA